MVNQTSHCLRCTVLTMWQCVSRYHNPAVRCQCPRGYGGYECDQDTFQKCPYRVTHLKALFCRLCAVLCCACPDLHPPWHSLDQVTRLFGMEATSINKSTTNELAYYHAHPHTCTPNHTRYAAHEMATTLGVHRGNLSICLSLSVCRSHTDKVARLFEMFADLHIRQITQTAE